MRNLVSFVKFQKREKRPWSSVTFSKVASFTKSNTHPLAFFTFFKFYKWYQIEQNITLKKKFNSLHLSRQYCKLIRNYCWQLFYRTTLAESFFTELFAITTLRICQLLLKPIILSNQTYTFKRQPYRMVQHTQTIHRLLPKNFLSVFDHFVELALKELIEFMLCMHLCDKKIFLLK